MTGFASRLDSLRTPAVLLLLAVAAMQIAWASWWTLFNNFAVDAVQATGREVGILQSVREIPGLLAVSVLLFLLFAREQKVMLLSLALFGAGVAVTGLFPTFHGFLITTLLMSVGFHYYEALSQSLALQWLDKKDAGVWLGRMVAAGAAMQLLVYGGLFLLYRFAAVPYEIVYGVAGAATFAAALALYFAFPQFPQHVVQHKHAVVRARYWLYYGLTFLNGARRQIFAVFALFMLVERFGFAVHEVAMLFIVTCVVNIFFPPRLGALIARFGERKTLTVEGSGMLLVFLGYVIVNDPWIAALLYCLDSFFFTFDIAHRTYLQKIADPADLAPTMGVSSTINHIAAVVLPFALGFVWIVNPQAVFMIGAGFALCALVLARLVPADPAPGNETLLARPQLRAAE